MFKHFLRYCVAAFAAASAFVLPSPSQAQLEDRPDRSHIVFAYMQHAADFTNGRERFQQYRWHALTHVGLPFTEFNDSGNLTNTSSFTGRSSELKYGGAADNNGVKVIMVLANSGFSTTTLFNCMTNATNRTNLVNNVIAQVSDLTNGCDGVSLDFEPFSLNAATYAGINQFVPELSAALRALSPPRELSIYVDATYSSSQYDYANLLDDVDYFNYSGYDFATGTTPTGIGRYGSASTFSIIGNLDDYLNPAQANIPARKMVLALPLYSRYWSTNSPTYGVNSGNSGNSSGFTEPNFLTTYAATPLAKFQSSPSNHETKWLVRTPSVPGPDASDVWTFEDEETLEKKLRLAKTWKGDFQKGRQLGGVAFWSMNWLAEGSGADSADPNFTSTRNSSNTSPAIRRMSNQPWRLWEEMFATPSTRIYKAEPFDGINVSPRWNIVSGFLSPDHVGLNGTPTVAGATVGSTGIASPPAGSQYVANLGFRFNAVAGNRLLLRNEVLMDRTAPARVDWFSSLVNTDSTTKFEAVVGVPLATASANLKVRMVVSDGNRQLEMGPEFTLSATGWQTISFDLANDAVTTYSTSEAAYTSGNGVINTAGEGEKDVSFVGFVISNSGASQAAIRNLYFDNITYTDAQPGNARYVINEYRYDPTNAQFVEIYGPAGAIPAGLRLRVVDGATGTTTSEVALSGTIPNDGGGFGYWVVGNSGVPNVDQTIPSSTLLTASPSALQLFSIPTGTIHDAIVYEAYSGVSELDGVGDPVVCDFGPSYLGQSSNGANSSGAVYTSGRYPDGANSWVNKSDFSHMAATPGASNGNAISIPVTFGFEGSAPTAPFRTFGNFSVQTMTPTLPVGSGSGTQAHRCADTSGGSMSYFGDAALGAGGTGYNVTGRVYVQPTTAAAQAQGLGIAVRQGSNFFSATPSTSGYESGYWLIYENTTGVNLTDGQTNHPQAWNFVYASNDGEDTTITQLLATATNASLGVTAGTWVDFRLSLNPSAPSGHQLLAVVNGVQVFRGNLPAGGPTAGAFAAGHRRTSGGTVAADGTWIDNLTINTDSVPVSLTEFIAE